MNCRDVRQLADLFVSEELLPETSHGILRHLEHCPSCQMQIDARHGFRRSLQAAFNRVPDLQPRADFAVWLRNGLLEAAAHERNPPPFPRRWLALAAGVLLAAGLAGIVVVNRSLASVDPLARDARGGHWKCALKNRRNRMPVPLEEAAERFDGAYRFMLTDPPDNIKTPNGLARVIDRHSCAFGTRRFAHVILNYRGHVVSLLVTANKQHDASGRSAPMGSPYLLRTSLNRLTVVSVRGPHHAVVLVSDLEEHELTELSNAMSVPLAQRLTGRVILPDPGTLAALDPDAAINPRVRLSRPERPTIAAVAPARWIR